MKIMKVKELIKILEKVNGNKPVVFVNQYQQIFRIKKKSIKEYIGQPSLFIEVDHDDRIE